MADLMNPLILARLGYFIAKVELDSDAVGYDTKLHWQS
jgi:hypothetical protein